MILKLSNHLKKAAFDEDLLKLSAYFRRYWWVITEHTPLLGKSDVLFMRHQSCTATAFPYFVSIEEAEGSPFTRQYLSIFNISHPEPVREN
jgi:hypothetical protein